MAGVGHRHTVLVVTADTSAKALPLPPHPDNPIWTIENLAFVFHLEVDSAREVTYRDGFPGAVKVGRRWTWDREDVLAWYRQQPKHSPAARRRAGTEAPAALAPASKPYKRRAA